jgi:hypothetical protein
VATDDPETWGRLVAVAEATDGEVEAAPVEAGGVILADVWAGLALVADALDSDATIVGHRFSYDLGVFAAEDPALLPRIFDALDRGRVSDTWLRQRLILIQRGGLHAGARTSLADLVAAYCPEVEGFGAEKGPDGWQLRYHELDGVPLAEWPIEARRYPMDDARMTLRVWRGQAAHSEGVTIGGFPAAVGGRIIGEERESRAAFALHLAAVWGLRTDPARVDDLIAEWTAAEVRGVEAATAGGWYTPPSVGPRGGERPGRTSHKRLREIVTEVYGGRPPLTPPSATFPEGQVSIATDTLIDAAGLPGAPETLRTYAESLQATRYLKVWGDALVAGTRHALTSDPVALVETGRTGWRSPPLQQPPRVGGVRECFVPRPGYVLCSVDYEVAELCALAQVHIWMGLGDTLARRINSGADVHSAVAAEIAAAEGVVLTAAEIHAGYIAKDPAMSLRRQLAKIANFGFAGGLGARTFVAYAGGYGVALTDHEAHDLRSKWLAAIPEMTAYFRICSEIADTTGTVSQFVSGRIRGGLGYTDACNGFFQGLVADGAKAAFYAVSKGGYSRGSPLYGVRPVLFIHDEIIAEVPESEASGLADEVARVMCAEMQGHIPDVTIRAEPCLMRRWSKKATSTRIDGRWTVWVE